jgi:replicative DNA helicase
VLAALLLDPRILSTITGRLRPEDFYAEKHRTLYQAMIDLQDDCTQIDLRTLQAWLEQQAKLDQVGGVAYLASLDLDLPDLGRFDAYAEIVKERSIRRRLIAAAGEMVHDCLDGGLAAEEAVGKAQQTVLELASEVRLLGGAAAGDAGAVTVLEMIEPALARYEAIRAGHRNTGLTTGLPTIDRACVGFGGRDLVILGGYAGRGKTSLVEDWVWRWAAAGERPLVVSLEMSRDQMIDRDVARMVETPLCFVRAARFRLDTLRAWAAEPAQRATAERIQICQPKSNVLAVVLAAVHSLFFQRQATVVVIDHLHRLTVPRLERRMEVDRAARSVKQLAVELEVPVIVPAQVSRAGIQGDNRPRLQHLGESGTIEQEADVGLMYHRPDHGPAELHVDKARQGEGGAYATLHWDERTRRSCEIDPHRADPPGSRRPPAPPPIDRSAVPEERLW